VPASASAMQITVRPETGADIALDVEPADTIENVKQKIRDKIGFPEARQRLVYNSADLDNSSTLYDYGILKDTVLLVYLRPLATPTIASPADGSTTGRAFVLNFTTDPYGEIQCRVDDGSWGVCPGMGDGTKYTVGWDTVLHWGEHSTDSMWAVGAAPGSPGCLEIIGGVCWAMPIQGLSTPTLNSFFTGLTSSATCADSAAQMTTFGGYIAFGSFNTAGEANNLLGHNKFSLNCDSNLVQVSGKLTNMTPGGHSLDVRTFDPVMEVTSSAARSEWTVAPVDSSTATSQSDGDGNVFINGDVLEFGAKSNGSFGTTNAAPAGFHERTESDEDTGASNGLGFVAPADPLTKDWTDELGDFFTPGGPYEGWRLTANGDVAANHDDNTDIEGTWDPVASGDKSVTWRSSAPFNGLDVTQTYSVPGTDQLIRGTVTLTNNSSAAVQHVAYARGVDPDNCVMDRLADGVGGDPYQTKNTTYSQFSDSVAHASVITAEASCNNETQISLYSGDTGSRVGVRRAGWARTANPFDLLNDDGTNYSVDQGSVVDDDQDMNLAIPANPDEDNVIEPGETATLRFTYSLSRAALISVGAINQLAPPVITDNPGKYTSQTSGSFDFVGVSGATFECAFESAAWTPCDSGTVGFDETADGAHTFKVRQINSDQLRSDPAVYTWTVDTQAPSAPTLSSTVVGETTSPDASLTYSGEPSARFTCSIDGSAFANCDASPVALSGLALGEHNFQIKQTDRAGNASSTTGVVWTVVVKPPAPVIKGVPYLANQAGWLNLTVSSDTGTTISCSIDGGLYAACGTLAAQPGPWQYTVALSNLNAGNHTLAVKAVTSGGTYSDIATASWKVGTPTTSLVFGKAPTVTTPKKGSGHWNVKLAVGAGSDRRAASRPMTVQLSTDTAKPSDTLTPPKFATYSSKVVRYAPAFTWNGKLKPRWLRIGNRAGRWTNWQAIAG